MSQMSASSITVRCAEARDAPAVVALVEALNLHEGDPTGHFDEDAFLRDCLGPGAVLCAFVAEIDGGVVGYAFCHPSYESAYAARGLFMSDLFVSEEARGLGVARAILAAVAAEARRMSACYVWWTAKPWNARAQAFYDSVAAYSEPVKAYALTFEAFERMADEGAAAAERAF